MSAVKQVDGATGRKAPPAIKIALDAGALRRCEFDCVIEGSDIEGAYRLGNRRFSAGLLAGAFESRRDMTDFIKEVVEDSVVECPVCANIRDE
jgi:hypothetical protein